MAGKFRERLHVSNAATHTVRAIELLREYQRTGDRNLLRRAIDDAETARSILERRVPGPPWHPLFPVVLAHLSHCYRTRYELSGDTDDLALSVTCAEQARAGAPDHELAYAADHNLGLSLLAQFERSGDVTQLDRAIELYTGVVAAIADDDDERPAILSNFSHMYRARYWRLNAAADLEAALRLAHESVDTAAPDSPLRAFGLGAISIVYKTKFAVTADARDLDLSIEYSEQSAAALPPTHVLLAGQLSNLAMEYMSRFEFSGALADIDRAVDLTRDAVARTGREDLDHSVYANNLGLVLRRRGERRNSIDDLRAAVRAGEDAVATIDADHADRPRWEANLGNAYRALYERESDPATIERALQLYTRALADQPADHPEHVGWLVNTAIIQLLRYRHTLDAADIDTAVELCRRALSRIPPEHPNRLRAYVILFDGLLRQFERTGERIPDEELTAVTNLLETVTAPTAFHRVRLGHVLGEYAGSIGNYAVAVRAVDHAVRMLPSVAPYELARGDQENALADHAGLVTEAVTAHLATGDARGALLAAEQGRAVLFGAALDARTDLTDLDGIDPALATEFRSARARLDNQSDTGDPAHARLHWDRYQSVLDRIRTVPMLETFLQPPSLDRLCPAVGTGYAVMVNAGRSDGQAVIVGADAGLRTVPLPALTRRDAQRWATELRTATHDFAHTAASGERLTELLGELWDRVVAPIAEALPTGRIARVWWIPIGPLAALPLHAAGHPGSIGALDVMVSSYIPSLRALSEIRGRPPATELRLTTVSMPATAGMSPLPGTVAEAAALARRFPGAVELATEQATVAAVARQLRNATWIHFACHATTDPVTPSNGGLHLRDGRLSISDVNRLRLEKAELAYLSACSTANTAVRHADESIHLAAAFLLAGFRHVIASLWPLDDTVAAAAAGAFYTKLPDAVSSDAPAAALHLVAHELRSAHRESPRLWAALVHSGP
ncbi:CHAT domain-containing protein [Nocardia aurantia]|uniref:CHAT domain-containing protein n=1 Tax=Nocardia aurantia TaxID=2585199 RepID=A0A7K0DNR9_9NOCA|nr:CHAT domain-containing protein [Nocardia aurantia]MQY27390.1 hypothetical protein [Nocardia aurantia]